MSRVIRVPPSKSITHRALICAALVRGESIINNPLVCEDTLATANALKAFGIVVEKSSGGWRVHGGPWQKPSRLIDCNESGTTYRFLTAITSVLEIPCELTGKPALLKRPMDDAITSQLLSGRLLAAPLANQATIIELAEPPVSKSYIELTIDVQKKFGIAVDIQNDFSRFSITPQKYQPTTLAIEGDWSSAACLLAAGVLKDGVTLTNLNPNSLQGDRAIVTILKEMGADIFWEGDQLVAKPSSLRGIDRNLTQTPDLYPIVAVLGALAKGKSTWKGLERLRFKESDRVAAMEMLVQNTNWSLAPIGIDSTDHRIIMAAAVLGRGLGVPMKFQHPECVAKSWPGFWEDFNSL